MKMKLLSSALALTLCSSTALLASEVEQQQLLNSNKIPVKISDGYNALLPAAIAKAMQAANEAAEKAQEAAAKAAAEPKSESEAEQAAKPKGVSEELKLEADRLKAEVDKLKAPWQAQVAQLFELKIAKLGTIADQLERFFGPDMRAGDQKMIQLGDILIPRAVSNYNRVFQMKQIWDGHGGNPEARISVAETAANMGGKIPQTGRHTTLLGNKHQDAADLYALGKYLTYLNIHTALPTADNLHKYEEELEALSNPQLHMFTAFVNTILGPKFAELLEGYKAEAAKKASSSSIYIIRDAFSKVEQPILKLTLNDLVGDQQAVWKADLLIAATLKKWRDKIATAKGSLVDRFALNSALFNSDLEVTSTTFPKMFAFQALKGDFDYQSTLKAFQAVNGWGICNAQMKLNFAQLENPDLVTQRRVNPIAAFVADKSKDTDYSFVEQLPQDAQSHKAFLKYIAYANMYYALTHNQKGEATPELQAIDPDLAKMAEAMGQSLIPPFRVDHVMRAQAIKWGQRLLDQHSEFIEDHALAAWFFYEGQIAADDAAVENAVAAAAAMEPETMKVESNLPQ